MRRGSIPATLLLMLLPGRACFHMPVLFIKGRARLARDPACGAAAHTRHFTVCSGTGKGGDFEVNFEGDPRQRESENAVASYNLKVSEMEPSCVCWLPSHLCVCSGLPVASPVAPNVPIDVVLYMHIKEFGRKSNTGMLAASQAKSKGGSLESVQALVSAHPEHENKLSELVESRPPGTVCVLYPAEGALPADEWLRGVPQGHVATVVLVDATWDQARRLSKRVPPEVVRVSLGGGGDEASGAQQDTRVNTLEALAGFLEVAWGDAASINVRSALHFALQRKSDALRMLHGNKQVKRGGVADVGSRRRRFGNVWRELAGAEDGEAKEEKTTGNS